MVLSKAEELAQDNIKTLKQDYLKRVQDISDKICLMAEELINSNDLSHLTMALYLFEIIKEYKDCKEIVGKINRVLSQKQAWKANGLCQYCGGDFDGIFIKRCVNCNKIKDY